LLYQVENLRSLRRLHGTLDDLVEAVLEQGIGRLEGPLGVRHELLREPAEVPEACVLAEALLAGGRGGGRILITPDGGLEIPVKVMIERALANRAVDYLGVASNPADVVLSLRPGLAAGAAVTVDPLGEHLRIVQVFKALQLLAGRRYRK